MAEETVSAPVANRYGRMEITGAFGDLGTLVPSWWPILVSSGCARSVCCLPSG
jgi:hypothetical protein